MFVSRTNTELAGATIILRLAVSSAAGRLLRWGRKTDTPYIQVEAQTESEKVGQATQTVIQDQDRD